MFLSGSKCFGPIQTKQFGLVQNSFGPVEEHGIISIKKDNSMTLLVGLWMEHIVN